jgi:hypothetical protein
MRETDSASWNLVRALNQRPPTPTSQAVFGTCRGADLDTSTESGPRSRCCAGLRRHSVPPLVTLRGSVSRLRYELGRANGPSMSRAPVKDPLVSRAGRFGRLGTHQSLKAADKVGGETKAKVLQCRRCQAGAVTLVADQDDPRLPVLDVGDVMAAGGVKPPFEHVPVDHHGTEKITVSATLLDRADVHEESTCGHLVCKVLGRHTLQSATSRPEQVVDRAHPGYPFGVRVSGAGALPK